MSFRRTKEEVTAAREWRQFVQAHQSLIERIGIPCDIVESERNWQHFLGHGYHPFDASGFQTGDLPTDRASVLVGLIAAYNRFRQPEPG
jgi:hypothetical protein